ncbi:PepSY domain-containing protein [Streptomyces sp. NPDC001339]|uniref:PepSY domain-containing protein n=1 Tax=Streptomyces sp. NPDC001339 TaxID=3364563 RepID=UPI0036A1085E
MKRHIVIATAAAAALIVGGTVTAVAVSGDGSAGAGVQTTAQGVAARGAYDQEDVREAAAAKVTAPEAAAAALQAVPGAVAGLDLDQDRPGLVWDADVLGKDGRWHEITLDARTGRVLNQRLDHGDDDDHARAAAALKDARTDAAAAVRTAARAHGTVTSIELDGDHRAKAVWEVETITQDGREHKLLVDPQSGKLTAAPAHRADGDTNGDDNDGADD